MIKPAHIQWSNGTPISSEFDDVYFNTQSGVDETRYVFLHHNNLAARWNNPALNHFTIAETGFGTGLNFLCAWDLWQQCSQPQQDLHFISVEKFPLRLDDLTRAVEKLPDFSHLTKSLLKQYPALVPGWHSLYFEATESHGSVTLHLFFGDIHDWLPNIHAKVDAWFLDGFAPKKNPDMWDHRLFHQMARLTKPNGTVATFTSAGVVKRGLSAAGFSLQKAPGFGKKRQMLTAKQSYETGPCIPDFLTDKPWFNYQVKQPIHKQAIVIGAGIAGCSTAHSLAKRGWIVHLLEQSSHIAAGASGNAQGVLYAKLASKLNPLSDFYLAGYLHTLRVLNQQLPDKQNWNDCGVLQMALTPKEDSRQQAFLQHQDLSAILSGATKEQASILSGVPLEHNALHFQHGAWLYPTDLCTALIKHKNIHLHLNCKVEQLNKNQQTFWQVLSNNDTVNAINASAVVVCAAQQSCTLDQLSFLPTKPIAGQVTQIDLSHLPLQTALCGEGYVTPTHLGKINFGASYRLNSDNTDITEKDNQDNFTRLKKDFPAVAQFINSNSPMVGRSSVRSTSPDYTPIAGPVCNTRIFAEQFEKLKKNKHWRFYESATFEEGLFVNLGHGSRGLTSAPLCGELVAAQANNDPWPMPKYIANLLSPNRFLVKHIND